ncbi:hypothetical protein CROQUDRAFT_107985, partial [Cronartium quercuum f. sp. fusiforme G11]
MYIFLSPYSNTGPASGGLCRVNGPEILSGIRKYKSCLQTAHLVKGFSTSAARHDDRGCTRATPCECLTYDIPSSITITLRLSAIIDIQGVELEKYDVLRRPWRCHQEYRAPPLFVLSITGVKRHALSPSPDRLDTAGTVASQPAPPTEAPASSLPPPVPFSATYSQRFPYTAHPPTTQYTCYRSYSTTHYSLIAIVLTGQSAFSHRFALIFDLLSVTK